MHYERRSWMDCHQADVAEQTAWRSSGERQTGPEWHLLGPPRESGCGCAL